MQSKLPLSKFTGVSKFCKVVCSAICLKIGIGIVTVCQPQSRWQVLEQIIRLLCKTRPVKTGRQRRKTRTPPNLSGIVRLIFSQIYKTKNITGIYRAICTVGYPNFNFSNVNIGDDDWDAGQCPIVVVAKILRKKIVLVGFVIIGRKPEFILLRTIGDGDFFLLRFLL